MKLAGNIGGFLDSIGNRRERIAIVRNEKPEAVLIGILKNGQQTLSAEKEVFMQEMRTVMPVSEVARIIMAMNRQEIETLVILLTEEGKELLKRKQDVESGKVRLLSREEVFDV